MFIKNNISQVLVFLLLVFAAISCSSPTRKTIDLESLSDQEDVLVTIHTPLGEMKAILYDQTPTHKANFVKLVNEGFYDGTLFHRVISQFMIQGGDPDSKSAEKGQVLGKGELPYKILPEIRPEYIHEKGALAAARKGDHINPAKESNGSQFYIVQGKVFTEQELSDLYTNYDLLYGYFDSLVHRVGNMKLMNEIISLQNANDQVGIQKCILAQKPTIEEIYGVELDVPIPEHKKAVYTTVGGAPALDGGYTVFGKIISGLEVLDKIASQPVDQYDRPLEDISMEISVEVMEKSAITKIYAYQYP